MPLKIKVIAVPPRYADKLADHVVIERKRHQAESAQSRPRTEDGHFKPVKPSWR